jgi:hypothetical protein
MHKSASAAHDTPAPHATVELEELDSEVEVALSLDDVELSLDDVDVSLDNVDVSLGEVDVWLGDEVLSLDDVEAWLLSMLPVLLVLAVAPVLPVVSRLDDATEEAVALSVELPCDEVPVVLWPELERELPVVLCTVLS